LPILAPGEPAVAGGRDDEFVCHAARRLGGEEADGVDDVLLADERVGGEAGGHVRRFRRVDDAVDDQEGDVDAILAEFLRGRVCERSDPLEAQPGDP
jgi:hypothetical protein